MVTSDRLKESVAIEFLRKCGNKVQYINDIDIQLAYGDLLVNNNNYVEVKSCYISNVKSRNAVYKHNTLAIDVKYFKPNTIEEYKQGNSSNSLGWIYHLKNTDVLIAVSDLQYKDFNYIGYTNSLFVINNFQTFRANLLNIYEDKHLLEETLSKYPNTFNVGISDDKRKDGSILKQTLTIYLNLDNTEFINNVLNADIQMYEYTIY